MPLQFANCGEQTGRFLYAKFIYVHISEQGLRIIIYNEYSNLNLFLFAALLVFLYVDTAKPEVWTMDGQTQTHTHSNIYVYINSHMKHEAWRLETNKYCSSTRMIFN